MEETHNLIVGKKYSDRAGGLFIYEGRHSRGYTFTPICGAESYIAYDKEDEWKDTSGLKKEGRIGFYKPYMFKLVE